MTRLANVTAIGAVEGRPAAAAAATAGQSMHQTARTREDTHPPTARTEPKERPRASHGQPHPADPPASGSWCAVPSQRAGSPARAGYLIAADPGLQPGGRPLPVAAGDQQRAALLTCPGRHRPGAGGRHRPPTKAEHHQIHAVNQHRGHLDRIGSGFGDDRDPAQVRPHFHGGEQADVGLADDRGVPTLGRHRRHHAQRQRPGARQHRHRPARQPRGLGVPPACGGQLGLGVPPARRAGGRFGHRQQSFRVGEQVRRRRRASLPAAHFAGHRRYLATQVFYLLSAAKPTLIQGNRCRHSSTSCTI